MTGEKIRTIALLAASVFVAAVAQYVLLGADKTSAAFWSVSQWTENFFNNKSALPGLLIYLAAGILFVAGLRNAHDSGEELTFAPAPISTSPVFGFWMTGLGLSILVAYYARNPGLISGSEYALGALWILAIVLFSVSVIVNQGPIRNASHRFFSWLKKNKLEILAFLAILSISFFVRFWDAELHPYSFINDEGEVGKFALCILEGVNTNCTNPFRIGWSAQPVLSFVPGAISVYFLGNTAIAIRLVSIVSGTLAVLGVYFFCREVFNMKIALLASLILATLPVHVHFSRIGVHNIMDSVYSTWTLWLIFRGAKRNSTTSYLAAGIISALGMYTYPGSRLAFAMGIGALVYIILRYRGFFCAQHKNVFIYLLAVAITAAPIWAYFSAYPDQFMARIRTEGIFTNGIMQNAVSQDAQIEYLLSQLLKSSLVFIASGAPSGFFYSPQPYLSPIVAACLVLGLVLVVWRIKDAPNIVLLAWFWAAIILGSTFTGGPPSSQRMLMSSPAAAIIAAVALGKISDMFARYSGAGLRLAAVIPILVILLNGAQNIYFYFYEYRAGHYFEDSTNELTYESRTQIASLKENGRFYLIGDPKVYVIFGNFEYFAPGVPKENFNTVTREALSALPKGQDALFIAPLLRQADIERIATWIPGGQWTEVHRRNQPAEVLYFSYKISAHQLTEFIP